MSTGASICFSNPKWQLSINQVSAERFLTNIQTLISDLNLPSRPSELGIRKQDARILLKNTLTQTRRIRDPSTMNCSRILKRVFSVPSLKKV